MRLKVRLLKPFSDIVGNKELHLDFEGRTLEGLLMVLVEEYPKLKDELYSEKHALADHVNIFVNDKAVTSQNETSVKLEEGDEVLLFIPISGG